MRSLVPALAVPFLRGFARQPGAGNGGERNQRERARGNPRRSHTKPLARAGRAGSGLEPISILDERARQAKRRAPIAPNDAACESARSRVLWTVRDWVDLDRRCLSRRSVRHPRTMRLRLFSTPGKRAVGPLRSSLKGAGRNCARRSRPAHAGTADQATHLCRPLQYKAWCRLLNRYTVQERAGAPTRADLEA